MRQNSTRWKAMVNHFSRLFYKRIFCSFYSFWELEQSLLESTRKRFSKIFVSLKKFNFFFFFKIIFLKKISVPLTVSSILISLINFIRTSWSLQAKDHLAKEELEGSLVIKTELKSFKQWTQILTHILWTFWTVILHGGSIVLLSLLGYVEMFSSELMESGSSVNIHILPFLVLCSSVPINLILYKMFINNKDSFSFAHAILSSVLPLR